MEIRKTVFAKILWLSCVSNLSGSVVLAHAVDFVPAEIRIEATIGEKTSSFSIRGNGNSPTLSYSVDSGGLQKIAIDRKNYDYVLRKTEEVIALAASGKSTSGSIDCPRELAEVEVIRDVKNIKSARICLLSGSTSAKVLLRLIEVIGTEFL